MALLLPYMFFNDNEKPRTQAQSQNTQIEHKQIGQLASSQMEIK